MTRPDDTRRDGISPDVPAGHLHDDERLRATWDAFVAEARALTRIDPDDLTPAQLDRLEAMSDPLIHLAGLAGLGRSRTPDASREPHAGGRARPRVMDLGTQAAGGDGRAPSERYDARRRALAARIVAGMEAERLGVRLVAGAPPVERARTPRRVDERLLADGERLYAAPRPDVRVAAGGGRLLAEAECDAFVPLPANVPPGRYLAFDVAGDSMEPLVHAGDTVLVRLLPRGGRPVAGTVVVACDPEHGYVVKEVGRLTAGGIELLSLNPAWPPLRVPLASGAVLGTVLLRWCPHGASPAASGA